jgi:hypothetical protein
MSDGYQGERKRTQKMESTKPKITFMEGLKLWANQWRWTNIKQIYKEEKPRILTRSMINLDRINQRLGR